MILLHIMFKVTNKDTREIDKLGAQAFFETPNFQKQLYIHSTFEFRNAFMNNTNGTSCWFSILLFGRCYSSMFFDLDCIMPSFLIIIKIFFNVCLITLWSKSEIGLKQGYQGYLLGKFAGCVCVCVYFFPPQRILLTETKQ